MEDNREINPYHDLQDKEKCSEARKQDKQPTRATERDNPRKRYHKDTPTLPLKSRLKKYAFPFYIPNRMVHPIFRK